MVLVEELLLQPTSTSMLLGLLIILLLIVYRLSSDDKSNEENKDPPGPKPLPILGNMLQLNLKRPYLTLCEMSKKYGSVFTVYFGPKKVIVLAGFQTVKQALVNYAEEFGNRDITPIFSDFNKGHGILFSNGETWKEMRRFSLTTLRDFGMGKRGSEEKIIEETHYLRKVFEEFQGKPFDTSQPLNYATSNVISAIVYGSRFQYSDPQFKEMVNRTNENIKLTGSPSIQIYNMFPWIGRWLKNWRLIMENYKTNVKQIKKLLDNLEETLNVEDSRCFVDSFLMRQKNAEKAGDKDSLFHEQNLIKSVSNLFAAGTETTSTTLRWCLLLMAKYPQVQERVHKEIDSVIGARQPVLEDRKYLPYTDAVIHETQRLANIVPMSLPHATSCDVTFQGFFIKKGTCVFPLLTSVLCDESQWESPHTFNPAHFLDEQGRFVKRDAFMPFSAGRRLCLGESLAKMELFLFFTSLLQHFHFTPPPGVSEEQLDLTPAVGFTLSPSPHKLCAISRTSNIYFQDIID
ncbi:cytochrome P450 2K1-like [Clarias gariepinus]|uniref:cytochrome P450 2K1-like n=1 Tax=Clarias gariepinus TaxID=13013 RepID=UPI00234CDCBB|nr:cytochrome P450 2K1-like [Clarias gariepinus]